MKKVKIKAKISNCNECPFYYQDSNSYGICIKKGYRINNRYGYGIYEYCPLPDCTDNLESI